MFQGSGSFGEFSIWVVVKIMVPFWIPIIIRQLIYRVPKKGPYFGQPPIWSAEMRLGLGLLLLALPAYLWGCYPEARIERSHLYRLDIRKRFRV